MIHSLIESEIEKIESRLNKKLMNKQDVADYLGLSVSDVTYLIDVGEITSINIGRNTFVKVVDLAKFLCGDSKKSLENNCEKTVDFGLNIRYPSPTLIEDLGEEEYNEMKRRGKGEGSVFFNKTRAVWQAAISLGYDNNGKRIRKIISAKEKSDVLEAMYKFMAEHKATTSESQVYVPQTEVSNRDVTFKEFLDNYLDNIKGGPQARTFRNYIGVAKHIEDSLGHIRMSQLTKDDLQRFINGFTEKTYSKKGKEYFYSQSMIHKIYMILKMVLRDASEKEIIKTNYMDYIKEPKSKKYTEEKHNALSDEEIKEIMKAVEDNNMLKTAVTIMLYTGMRPGEVFALKFSDIDYKKNTITVKRALSFKQEVNIKEKKPKSTRIPIIKEIKNERGGKVPNAKRELEISHNVIKIIKERQEYLETMPSLIKAKKKNDMQDYLFCGIKGNLVLVDYYTQVYRRHLKKKGLDSSKFRLYRFRHTFCTRLLKIGVEPNIVAKMMGDNTLDMVLKVYATINKDDILKASNNYSNMIDDTLGDLFVGE